MKAFNTITLQQVATSMMKVALGLFLSIAFVYTAQAQSSPNKLSKQQINKKVASYNYRLGTQAIGGNYQFTKDNRLIEQAKQVKNMGSNIMKFSLGKGTLDKYFPEKLAEKGKNAKSALALINAVPAYQKVMDMDFKYYQTWIHSLTKAKWRNGLSQEETKLIYSEMYQLTEYLLKRYQGTGKVFLLGNWEGDWLIHPKRDRNKSPSKRAINGMIKWLNVRQQAIDDAKRYVAAEGVEVYHYVEANLVKKAMDGKPSLAHSVLPKVNVDFVSYSAYESIKDSYKPNMEVIRKPLTAAVNYLNKQLKAKPGLPFKQRVFLGEYGFQADKNKPDTVKTQFIKSRFVMQVALELDMPFALIWQMYNNEYTADGKSRQMSLIDEEGERRALFYLHKAYYQKMKYFVLQSYKTSGKPPSDEAFKEKALLVLNFLSMKQVGIFEKKFKAQKAKERARKKTQTAKKKVSSMATS